MNEVTSFVKLKGRRGEKLSNKDKYYFNTLFKESKLNAKIHDDQNIKMKIKIG